MRWLAILLFALSCTWGFSASIVQGLPEPVIAGSLYPLIFDLNPTTNGLHQIELVVEYPNKDWNETFATSENCYEKDIGVHLCNFTLSSNTEKTINFSFHPGVILPYYSIMANFYAPFETSPATPQVSAGPSYSATGGASFLKPRFDTPKPPEKPKEPINVPIKPPEIIKNDTTDSFINQTEPEDETPINYTNPADTITEGTKTPIELIIPDYVFYIGAGVAIIGLAIFFFFTRKKEPGEKMSEPDIIEKEPPKEEARAVCDVDLDSMRNIDSQQLFILQ